MKKPTNVVRQIKAAYGQTSKPGKPAPAGRPMKTVMKGRMLTRKKP